MLPRFFDILSEEIEVCIVFQILPSHQNSRNRKSQFANLLPHMAIVVMIIIIVVMVIIIVVTVIIIVVMIIIIVVMVINQ